MRAVQKRGWLISASVLFGTADIARRYEPTGIRDQLPEDGGPDDGRGFWLQQWRGLLRAAGRA